MAGAKGNAASPHEIRAFQFWILDCGFWIETVDMLLNFEAVKRKIRIPKSAIGFALTACVLLQLKIARGISDRMRR